MEVLPTPFELIDKALADLKRLELHEGDKEHLTQIASNLNDFYKKISPNRAIL